MAKPPSRKAITKSRGGSRKRSAKKAPHEVMWSNFGRHFAKMSLQFGSQPITSMIGLIAAASLLLSVSFHVGYLITLDYRLLPLFSIQDAISNAIPAVPVVATASIVMILIFDLLTESFVKEFGKKFEKQPLTKKEERWTRVSLFVLFCLGIMAAFLFSIRIVPIIFVVILVMLLLGSLVTRKSHLPQAAVLWWVIGVSVFSLIFAALGEIQAVSDLLSKDRNYRMTINGQRSDVLLLRATGDVFIVRDDPRTIRVVRRDNVSEMKVLNVGERLPWWSFSALRRWAFPVQNSDGYHGR